MYVALTSAVNSNPRHQDIFPCQVGEISQNLQKMVFFSLNPYIKQYNNVHPVIFFSENRNLTHIPLQLGNRGLISGHGRGV